MVLKNYPFPPSVNKAYPSAKNGRRFASKELRQFKHNAKLYEMAHKNEINYIKGVLKDYIKKESYFIEISAYFERPYTEIWTQKVTIKQRDVSNRIKALHDALQDTLEIKDHYFSIGRTTFTHGTKDQVHLIIKPVIVPRIEHINFHD